MLNLKKFFAYLAVFLGFYFFAFSFNLNHNSKLTIKCKGVDFIKEKKNSSDNLPFQIFEPVDESELDEDKQIKLSLISFAECQLISTLLGNHTHNQKLILPHFLNQNYAVTAPRIILFQSWKFFI